MKDEYVTGILARAEELRTGEIALRALSSQPGTVWRWAAAAAAALVALYPSVSAAMTMM